MIVCNQLRWDKFNFVLRRESKERRMAIADGLPARKGAK